MDALNPMQTATQVLTFSLEVGILRRMFNQHSRMTRFIAQRAGFKTTTLPMIHFVQRSVLLGLALLLFNGCGTTARRSAANKPLNILMLGGGSSHDFQKWFGDADSATLRELPNVTATYTEAVDTIVPQLAATDVLYLSNNNPFTQAATRQAIMDHVNQGRGLVIVHAGMWYSWRDWPEFNRVLVGGGSRGHDRFGEFEVKVTDPAHPVMAGVPASFRITDELYWQESDPAGTPIKVLATAHSNQRNKTYPSIFIVEHPKARIVGIALGHDGKAHEHPAYKQLLKNAVSWAARRP